MSARRAIVMIVIENEDGVMEALSPFDMFIDELNIETPVERDPMPRVDGFVVNRHTGEITINIRGRRRLG